LSGSQQFGLFALTSVAIRLWWKLEDPTYQTAGKPSTFLKWSLVMTPAVSPSLNLWKTLYRAALLETNTRVLPQRVSEAEEAVRARGREIVYGGGSPEEKEALEDALYALRAFRTAWQHTEAA
jgi:hypothetical protein